jgi:Domain of unknown function DUF83
MNKEQLVTALLKADGSRKRSKQTVVGVSALGDCRAKVWHIHNKTKPTNETYKLAAIMGTAIHSSIEKALTKSGGLIEHRIEAKDGLPPATIDYFDPTDGSVVDWKTTKKSGLAYFPSRQQRWQVQVYGYLMAKEGFEVNTVNLVAIARDGDERDIVWHSEPYNETVALEALAWLEAVKAEPFAPAPEKDATFCAQYCPYFGQTCGGISKELPAGEPISDPIATQAALDYKNISQQIKDLTDLKESARTALEGVNGVTFDGIKVSWSSSTTNVVDKEAIEKALGSVPTKQGATSERLTVK